MDYYSLFWRLGVIATINEPWGALTCRSSTLTVLADCCPFRGVLLTVLDPGVISTLNESRGVLMCRSSTLTVLADSGPVRGLLLTVLASQSDFHN